MWIPNPYRGVGVIYLFVGGGVMVYLKTILKNAGMDKTAMCENCGVVGMIVDDQYHTCNECCFVQSRS